MPPSHRWTSRFGSCSAHHKQPGISSLRTLLLVCFPNFRCLAKLNLLAARPKLSGLAAIAFECISISSRGITVGLVLFIERSPIRYSLDRDTSAAQEAGRSCRLDRAGGVAGAGHAHFRS